MIIYNHMYIYICIYIYPHIPLKLWTLSSTPASPRMPPGLALRIGDPVRAMLQRWLKVLRGRAGRGWDLGKAHVDVYGIWAPWLDKLVYVGLEVQ